MIDVRYCSKLAKLGEGESVMIHQCTARAGLWSEFTSCPQSYLTLNLIIMSNLGQRRSKRKGFSLMMSATLWDGNLGMCLWLHYFQV